jgi:hypothetical protein
LKTWVITKQAYSENYTRTETTVEGIFEGREEDAKAVVIRLNRAIDEDKEDATGVGYGYSWTEPKLLFPEWDGKVAHIEQARRMR